MPSILEDVQPSWMTDGLGIVGEQSEQDFSDETEWDTVAWSRDDQQQEDFIKKCCTPPCPTVTLVCDTISASHTLSLQTRIFFEDVTLPGCCIDFGEAGGIEFTAHGDDPPFFKDINSVDGWLLHPPDFSHPHEYWEGPEFVADRFDFDGPGCTNPSGSTSGTIFSGDVSSSRIEGFSDTFYIFYKTGSLDIFDWVYNDATCGTDPTGGAGNSIGESGRARVCDVMDPPGQDDACDTALSELPSYPNTFTGACSAHLIRSANRCYDFLDSCSIQRFKPKFTIPSPLGTDLVICYNEHLVPTVGSPTDTPRTVTISAGDTEVIGDEVLEPSDDGVITITDIKNSCDNPEDCMA